MNFLISFSTLSIQSTLFSILTLTSTLNAQEIIFPGLRGDSLITELKKYYTPKTILPYDQARTKLYTEIFLQNDSIRMLLFRIQNPVPAGNQHPFLDCQVWHPNRTSFSKISWISFHAGTR
jgi:hypothetical protein